MSKNMWRSRALLDICVTDRIKLRSSVNRIESKVETGHQACENLVNRNNF